MSGRTALLFTLCIFLLVPGMSAAGILLSGEDVNQTIGFQSGSITTCKNISEALLLSGDDTRQTHSLQAVAILTCKDAAAGILLSGQDVSTTLFTQDPFAPQKVPGSSAAPTDPDHDGIYEDLNGNGRLDFADVVLYFNQMTWIAANEPVCAFDLNGNGRIDFADIVALFNEI
jgi:PKD repeat protein